MVAGDEKVRDLLQQLPPGVDRSKVVTDLTKSAVLPKDDKVAVETADFKIEIVFGKNRTPTGTNNGGNSGILTIYTAGTSLAGGGDEMVYWCDLNDIDQSGMGNYNYDKMRLRRKVEKRGCGKPTITSKYIMHRTEKELSRFGQPTGKLRTVNEAVCPQCTTRWHTMNIPSQIFFRMSTQKWAKKIAEIWRMLGGKADIVCKYHYSDIRYKAQERQHGTLVAQEQRGMLVYPMTNIIKDTCAGASLENRFKAMLQQ